MKKLSILLLSVILTGCFGSYEVPFWSMEPTIKHGARIKIDNDYYSERKIERFDIVGYVRPDNGELQVKRIIGLGGDKIAVRGGVIYLNGTVLVEPMLLEQIKIDFPEMEVPKGHYFLMGDNRNQSRDSRMFGALPEESITGQVVEVENP